MIEVQVNGRIQELAEGISVLAYLERIGANPKAVAVELDGEILDRSAYATSALSQGSVMEIVRMVGGGRPTAGIRFYQRPRKQPIAGTRLV